MSQKILCLVFLSVECASVVRAKPRQQASERPTREVEIKFEKTFDNRTGKRRMRIPLEEKVHKHSFFNKL